LKRAIQEPKKAFLIDIILKIFIQLGDSYFQEINKDYKPNSNFGPHQYAFALNHVGEMFNTFVGNSESVDKVLAKEDYLKKISKPLSEGAAIMLSTELTGGHIVYLKEIKSDGLVIHDPYGMRMPGGYVKNNSYIQSAKNKITDAKEAFKIRTKENYSLKKTILDQIDSNKIKYFTSNLGESNFYSWTEVVKYNIGKWINILYKK